MAGCRRHAYTIGKYPQNILICVNAGKYCSAAAPDQHRTRLEIAHTSMTCANTAFHPSAEARVMFFAIIRVIRQKNKVDRHTRSL